MVAYTRALLLGSIFFQASQVFAIPAPDIVARDIDIESDWVDSSFVKCMKAVYPNYPQGSITPDNALKCHTQTKANPKRSLTNAKLDTEREIRGLEARDLNSLAVSQHPDCDGFSDGPLPKNFMIVTDVRNGAQGWCNQMKNDLINYGAAQIDQKMNNAVTKTANELRGHKAVALSLLFSLTPRGRLAIKTMAVADQTVLNTCAAAIQQLATKGSGCTRDINWYNAGKAKGQTSTGARGGSLDISHGDDDFGFIDLEFLNPQS